MTTPRSAVLAGAHAAIAGTPDAAELARRQRVAAATVRWTAILEAAQAAKEPTSRETWLLAAAGHWLAASAAHAAGDRRRARAVAELARDAEHGASPEGALLGSIFGTGPRPDPEAVAAGRAADPADVARHRGAMRVAYPAGRR
ncbi:MAG TPA: hypothetical protein DCY89_05640 [Gammaproteobacteria bacterium]|nr:hypothetical protein [Gammaproteobacteria bacterium]